MQQVARKPLWVNRVLIHGCPPARRASVGSRGVLNRCIERWIWEARQCTGSAARLAGGHLLQLTLDRGVRAAIRFCVIRLYATFEPFLRLLLRLLAEERDDIVFEKHPCAPNPSADDVTLLRELHRRGAVDLEEVGAFL